MGTDAISMDSLIARVKAHSGDLEGRMILCHNGIVRASDRSGARKVQALKVVVDRSAIENIRSWAESKPGIVAVAIEALEGEFQVGDDLLYVVVAGDVRENVFAVTREVVEKIKAGGVQKTEFYAD